MLSAVDTIAKALIICKRGVQYNTRKLECAGYIIQKERWYNHQQLTNQYVFNPDMTEDRPDNENQAEICEQNIQREVSDPVFIEI